MWYRNHGDESYDTGRKIKYCCQCQLRLLGLSSLWYLNLTIYRQEHYLGWIPSLWKLKRKYLNALHIISDLPYKNSLECPSDSASVPTPFPRQVAEVPGDNLKLYTGGCYCGAVTLAVKMKPWSEVEIKEDNCSICQRVGIQPRKLPAISGLTGIEC